MSTCCIEKNSHHNKEFKKKLKNRLNRIEGQVRGVSKMIEEDVYCDDVLTQISSIRSALSSTATLLLEAHMKSCVIEQIKSGDDEVIDELLLTIKRMMK
jgi:DNA-binding FrmR family transcriptional regulator